MAPRPRKPGRKDLPPNCYCRHDARTGKDYYSFRDPATGRTFGLGTDKDYAIAQVAQANAAMMTGAGSLLTKIAEPKPSGHTLREWLEEYRKVLTERGMKPRSLQGLEFRLRRIDARFGDTAMAAITTRELSDWLKEWTTEGKTSMAKVMRSLCKDVFREAMVAGWVDKNPVEVIRPPRVVIKRERLSWEGWQAIYAQASQPWLKRAMELALLTTQRREDLALLRFSDFKEQDRRLQVVQGKTGARLRIDTSLGLERLGMTISDAIKLCRDDVVSRYMLHLSKTVGAAKAGAGIVPRGLTQAFADARNRAIEAGTLKAGDNPPSFHELRSLGSRLYREQGTPPEVIQALMGHRNAAMTEVYQDVRGSEWIEVAQK